MDIVSYHSTKASVSTQQNFSFMQSVIQSLNYFSRQSSQVVQVFNAPRTDLIYKIILRKL